MDNEAAMTACLYRTRIMHRRHQAPANRFSYQAFGALFDIDRLPDLAREHRLFGYNRAAPVSFHDADHGPRDGSPLRPWLQHQLDRAGVDFKPVRVRLFCIPRVFGHAFNPLSLWFCEDGEGQVRALLCEVHNTFGESHGYLLHEGGASLPDPIGMRRSKVFHVSPFFPVDGEYRFRIAPPDGHLDVRVELWRNGEPALLATQLGERIAFSDRALLRELLATPWITLRVLALIHWQALRLWWRGARFHRKPAPPGAEITAHHPEEVR